MTSTTIPPLPVAPHPSEAHQGSPLPRMPRPADFLPAHERPRPPVCGALATAPTPRSPTKNPQSPLAPMPRAEPSPETDYSDRDLAEALRPLIETATLPDPGSFEPLIRATFRRTLAEHTRGPFDPPDILHRAVWRLDALFHSRSYEEILDEKMQRFRIEEIHLLDRSTLEPISIASVNPTRHTDPRRTLAASARIANLLGDPPPDQPRRLPYSKSLNALIIPGSATFLAALIRGRPDPLVEADLDYALRRLEARFATPLAAGTPLLRELQPLLEECLLIHSPPSPLPR